ncbi:MAG: hypothetical protein KAS17_06400 [Victivallaceae bacterium]|nr:hypothetical protein [Victivallaceae bacterium]
MTIRKKHNIRHYTIVEVMVAMAIFLVMMTIMMQFFTSAQKVWNLSSKRNDMYADARVAMNLMTREIQSMLFRNEATDGTGIYPFWYEWSDFDDTMPLPSLAHANSRRTDLDTYLKTEENLQYLTQLNFISTTDLKPVDEGSDICEIRYRFIPFYFKADDATGVVTYTMGNVRGGYLQRSCLSEISPKAGGGVDLSNDLDTVNVPYNFNSIPNRGNLTELAIAPATYNTALYQNRVINIWDRGLSPFFEVATTIEEAKFQTVIGGVYSLRFTCYVWDSVNNKLITLDPMNTTAPGENPSNIPIANPPRPYAYDLATGTPVPVAVRIDMKLLAPGDLKKLAFNIYVEANGSASEQQDATRQIRALKQKMRTFSKVIYLGKREN